MPTFTFHPLALAVTVLTPKLIRLRYARNGKFAKRRAWAVTKDDSGFAPTGFETKESAQEIIINTNAISIHIEKSSGKIHFTDPQNQIFCADASSVTSVNPSVAKSVATGEHFYGFGERTYSSLERSGRLYTHWATDTAAPHTPNVDRMYVAIPIYFSIRPNLAYAVYFNNTYRSQFDVGCADPNQIRFSADGGEMDYYVFYGPTPREVNEGIAQLLGTHPLPPRWALGYHQSRWGYKSDKEIRKLAKEFRKRQIPCDVIHFDIDYMDGYRVFTWHPARFKNPKKLIADLRRDGFRTATIIDPGVKADKKYFVYQEGLKKNYFIKKSNGRVFHGYVWPDDSVFADFTREEVRAWWGDLQKHLTDKGVSGIWNDMNEPAVFSKPFSEGGGNTGTIPLDAKQSDTTHAEAHNVFGYNMSRASYEGLRKLLPDERAFTLTRSGFAGMQKFSAGWSGDNHAWWEHLEASLPQLCNWGLSGVSFLGVDIGGFNGDVSPELFVRWMQIGSLYPFARGHSHTDSIYQEPWRFGERVEKICRDYLRLRYRLLPYLYSLFYESSQHGTPIWRPMFYHYPNEITNYHLHDQILLGEFLLVAPITKANCDQRTVYLPQGEWFDYWTDEKIVGATHITARAPLEVMPLYVRAGAVIPTGPELNYADEKPLSPLTLDVYAGEGEFTLYEDDGHTFEYESGVYAKTRLETRDSKLKIHKREGKYAPPPRKIIIRPHGFKSKESIEVEDDGMEKRVEIGS